MRHALRQPQPWKHVGTQPDRSDGTMQAAIMVPVIPRPQGTTVLLTRRTAHLAHHPGQISFPGGRRDPVDLSAADTALREAQEEVGIDRSLVEVLGYLDDFRTGTGFCITPVLGIIDPSVTFAASRDEVEHVFEIPLDYALDPTNYRQVSAGERELRRSYFVIEYADHHVWGATAGILVNLREKARTMTQFVHLLDGDH